MLRCGASLTLYVIISAAVGFVGGVSPEVTEGSSPYPCCENPKIQFNRDCEHIWSTNNKIIAYWYSVSRQACIPPCKAIEGGWMMLDQCAKLNVTVVCADERNVAEEKRIYYHGQPCSASLLGPGDLVFLLTVVIGGQFVL